MTKTQALQAENLDNWLTEIAERLDQVAAMRAKGGAHLRAAHRVENVIYREVANVYNRLTADPVRWATVEWMIDRITEVSLGQPVGTLGSDR